MSALTTIEGLCQAIRESPDDADLVRVYAGSVAAGDADRAEHIWVQLALGMYPLGNGWFDSIYQALFARDEVLRERYPWRGALMVVEQKSIFRPEFRRGLVQSAEVTAHPFLKVRDVFRRQCPFLRRLEIDHANGWGRSLARLAALEGMPELSFLGWLKEADARGLAESPYLKDLKTLEIWLGSRHDRQVVQALAALPGLQRLVLHQMFGGLQAYNQARDLAEHADGLAQEVNQQLGKTLAVVHRPWERSFPLYGSVGHELYAGRLGSGELALCGFRGNRKAVVLHRFSPEGHFLGHEDHSLAATRARCRRGFRRRQLLAFLEQEFGFKLCMISVKEFRASSGLGISLYLAKNFTWLATPDDPPTRQGKNDTQSCSYLNTWIKEGWFEIDVGDNNFTVERFGKIFNCLTESKPARLRGT